jgi:hypothetical protein
VVVYVGELRTQFREIFIFLFGGYLDLGDYSGVLPVRLKLYIRSASQRLFCIYSTVNALLPL